MPESLPAPERPPFPHTPRPVARRTDVTTDLLDFALVTYAVAPNALAAHLPPGFEPDVFRLDDGSSAAFVSAVPFRDHGFHFTFAPWARFAFCQTNYRAYVRHRGERGVWFFGTTLGTLWNAIPRLAWRLPWHRARFELETRWGESRCESYRLRTAGAWGAAEMELEGTAAPMGRLDGFADENETALVLTHPLTGWYRRRDGVLGTYSVWHVRLDLQRASVRSARFEVFERLGLVRPGQAPHSVLVQRKTEFIIRLPPARLAD